MFEFEARRNYDPTRSQSFAAIVNVGSIIGHMTEGQLEQAMREVPVKNHDMEFNCQQWVEGALEKLKDGGHLSQVEYKKGVDGMVDALMEATDE
jgi:hypothetical protein